MEPHSGGGKPELPRPTLWPVGFAIGVACILVGLVVSWPAVGVGGAIATLSAAITTVAGSTFTYNRAIGGVGHIGGNGLGRFRRGLERRNRQKLVDRGRIVSFLGKPVALGERRHLESADLLDQMVEMLAEARLAWPDAR